LGHKPVPVSRLGRLWTLGSVHAKVAAGYLAFWVRTSFAAADEKEQQLNEAHLSAAIKLLGAMSYLRGGVMKVGQMLANYPHVVPEQYIEALSSLHFEAPPMHFSLVREFMRDELGGDPLEVFAEFETQAFAAASLGQVHRARLKTGEPVAVKVQYPGIAKTIQSDFRNMLAVFAPMRLTKDWDNIREQWEDIRRVVEQETDYRREAAFQQRASALFDPAEGIVIPAVRMAHTTNRVLTMDYLDGVHLDRYLALHPVQEERDCYGERIMRASFRIAHRGGFWYADANPGNFLFLRGGGLGLIDFGCCREFSTAEWGFYKQVGRAYVQGHGLRDAVIRSAALDPEKPDEEYVRFLEEYSHWLTDYMVLDRPWDFGDEAFIRRGADLIAETIRRRRFRSLPVNIWIIRQILGLRGVAYRLKARVNMKRIGDDENWGVM
jgi:predicted unusual protein kinase regulating ubiquinone biosynthesis (AarF/ABC1/UbiB family)